MAPLAAKSWKSTVCDFSPPLLISKGGSFEPLEPLLLRAWHNNVIIMRSAFEFKLMVSLTFIKHCNTELHLLKISWITKVLKMSVVKCWSIALSDTLNQHPINTQSTLDQHLGRQLVRSRIIFNQCIWVSQNLVEYQPAADQLSIKCQLSIRWDVDRVWIKMSISGIDREIWNLKYSTATSQTWIFTYQWQVTIATVYEPFFALIYCLIYTRYIEDITGTSVDMNFIF